MQDGSRPADSLAERFPDLRPVSRAPGGFTFNGFGVALYGRSQPDLETSSHVKTRYLCALFVPLLGLDAYRVLDDGRVLGKVPLPPGVKLWNQLVLLALLAGGGLLAWSAHTSSPEYRAQQQLDAAERRLEAGELPEAASAFASLHDGPRHDDGLQGLGRVLDAAASAELASSAQALVAVGDSEYAQGSAQALFTPARADALVSAALAGCEASPRDAWEVLEALAPHAPAEVTSAREPVLVACVAAAPEDAELVSELALLHEAREDVDACLALLRPLAGRLGATEGARILGQLLLYQGELEPAFAELEPYVQGRLGQLGRAEADYDRELDAGWKRALAQLDAGAADPAWYASYEGADDAEQGRMVQAWAAEFLEDDRALQSASARYGEATAVVPVALDLGILQLQRAQADPDPNVRKAKLQAAEQVFLAVQGVAGDSAAYRLNLGKVQYWLGKGEEGHALFEALLEESQRDPQVLLAVARELRDVGAVTQARALAEEAWERAEDGAVKYAAADFRGRFGGEAEELITWLERADPDKPEVQASLSAVRGRHALVSGDLDAAGRHLREALRLYDQLPRSAAALNNAALASYELFQATGEREALTTYVERLLEAERLEPADAILLGNVSQALHMRALLQAASELDFGALILAPGDAVVPFLGADDAGLREVEAKLAASEDLRGAISRYEQLLVVSPRDPSAYVALLSSRWYGRDLAATEALGLRLRRADLDLSDRQVTQARWLEEGPDPTDVASLRRQVVLSEAALERARERGGVTFAFAVSRRIELAESLLGAREPVDGDALVALAEEAQQVAPSLGTWRTRIAARLLRARLRLGAQPAFEASEARRHAYGAVVWVGALLAGGDEVQRAALAADPDVQQAAAWIAEQGQRWPERQQPWHWAILQALDPPAGERCADALRSNALGAARAAMYGALEPLSVSNALDAHWRARIGGNDELAARLLADARELGIPLPFSSGD